MATVFGGMQATPYWWEAAPRPAATEVDLPAAVDVAIVGAGYTGLHAALVLTRAGLSVMVFEANLLGSGASTLNGGMVGPSFHKLGVLGLKRRYGEDRARAILRESVGFVDFLQDFLTAEGIECGFRRTGRFRGALQPAHYDTMARELEALHLAAGVEGEMLPAARQQEEVGSDLFHGGVIYHRDGGLHPGLYHDGLAERARAAGAMIAAGTAVTGLTRRGDGFTVTTERGVVRADQVAICTNGYTGKLTPAFRRRVLPLRSAMIATQGLPPGLLQRLVPKNRVLGDSRRVVAYYRKSPDGTRMLFGGRAAGTGDNPRANAHHLRRMMLQVFPELAATRISHSWSGLVAYTFDHAPHIGMSDGLHFALGYCGSVLRGPAISATSWATRSSATPMAPPHSTICPSKPARSIPATPGFCPRCCIGTVLPTGWGGSADWPVRC
jgi:glycine/D-amino acid oxidase-like deaminating enzyme